MKTQLDAEGYAKAKAVFFAAMDLKASERTEFVRLQCGRDLELLSEVESLLSARQDLDDFLNLPALAAVSTHEDLLGTTIGGYRLLRELGEGGMGVVFLAEKDDAEFRNKVALKLVKTGLDSKTIFKHFHVERQILHRLEHPNISRLIDGGTTKKGVPYFVMEYVEGQSLMEFVKTTKASLASRLELFRQVCAAVAFAHQHAVIHRDLKPSNILVTSDARVKLLDFGIAKLIFHDGPLPFENATTLRAMTPEYASPEQIQGRASTTVSDVYSLGIILYELLTDVRPYKTDSTNLSDVVLAICETEPARPSSLSRQPGSRSSSSADGQEGEQRKRAIKLLRGDLDNIVLKALRKEPLRRYSSVEALWDDIQRHLDGLPVSAGEGTFFYRAEKFIRRNRLAVSLTSLIALAVIGGIVMTLWQARRAQEQRVLAERRFNDVRALANSLVFEMNDEILKGQTQGRELVVRRALEYLNRLAGESTNDASLQRELAVAYLKIGDIQGKPYSPNLGDTDGAIASYDKARTMLERLYRTNPTSRQIQEDLSRVYIAIGSIQQIRKSNGKQAAESLQKARELSEALVAAEPTNTEYCRTLADIYKALGDNNYFIETVADRKERIAWHRKALALREQLLSTEAANTEDQAAIASLHQRIAQLLENIANVTHDKDDLRASLDEFDNALAIYEALLSREPNNSRHRRNVADITAARIPLFASLGNKTEAIKSHTAAMAIFDELATADPKNAEAQLDVAYTYRIMCRSLLTLDDPTGAVKSCQKGLQVAESMISTDPSNAEVCHYIIVNNNLIGDALKVANNKNAAMRSYQQALVAAERCLASDPQNLIAQNMVANTRQHIETLHAEMTRR